MNRAGLMVVLLLALAGTGCSCGPFDQPDAPLELDADEPDAIDPLEPCSSGVRRAVMDLLPGGGRVAMRGDGERLWVADAVTGPTPTARITELALDGTRVSSREVALPAEMVSPEPALVLSRAPITAVYASGDEERAFVSLGDLPSATGLRFPETVLANGGGEAVIASDPTTPPGTLFRIERDATRAALDPGFLGIDAALTIALSPSDELGRGGGAFWTSGGLTALTYDFSATPSSEQAALGITSSASGIPRAPRVARTDEGWLVLAATEVAGGGTTVHAAWIDEALELIAVDELSFERMASPLGAVSTPIGDLVVIWLGSEIRVALASEPGELRGATRALAVIAPGELVLGDHVWSAIEGSVSVALEHAGSLEVITLCASP